MSSLSLTVPLAVSLTGGRATAVARVTNGSAAEVRVAVIAISPAGGTGGEAWTTVTDPLREIPAVSLTVEPGSSENYLASMRDANAQVEYRLAMSNVPVSPGQP